MSAIPGHARAFLRCRGVKGLDPICGSANWRFTDGPRSRPDALCPTCASAERHRAMWLFLERQISCVGLRVLHVSPESGIEQRLRRVAGTYVSTDLDPERGDVAADLTRLPFADGSFDVAIVSHVLEHIPDDVAAVRELQRVLAPGGALVLQVPIDRQRERTFEDWTITTPEERERAFFQADHVRIYGLDFADRVRSGGFPEVMDVRVQDRLSAREVLRYRLRQYPSSSPARDLEADRIFLARRD